MIKTEVLELTTADKVREYFDKLGFMNGSYDTIKTSSELKKLTKADCKNMYYILYGGFPMAHMRKIDIILEVRRYFECMDRTRALGRGLTGSII